MNTWRAGCGGNRMSGSEGGPGKPTSRKAGRAPWSDPYTEIPTDEGKLYMATVLDLFSRRLLACPTSEHPDAQLVCDGIKIAAAARGGRTKIEAVIFHTDRGSTYTASSFTLLCKDKLGIRQSMGRVGSCFDNAAAESFFSTLEHEVLSRHHFTTKAQARTVVLAWCHEFYNTHRRHSSRMSRVPWNFSSGPMIIRLRSRSHHDVRHRHSARRHAAGGRLAALVGADGR